AVIQQAELLEARMEEPLRPVRIALSAKSANADSKAKCKRVRFQATPRKIRRQRKNSRAQPVWAQLVLAGSGQGNRRWTRLFGGKKTPAARVSPRAGVGESRAGVSSSGRSESRLHDVT